MVDPDLAVAYYNRGDTKYAEGNLDGAIADYTQAVTLNPKIALAYCHRGSARQAKGDADGATLDYNEALAINPKMAIAYYNRGLLREQKGDLNGAIADSTQAIALDPKDAQAYCNRGLARLGQNDLDEALSDLKTFCQMAPRNSDADYARLYIWLISKMENPHSKADDDLATSLRNDWNSTPEDLESKIAAYVLGHLSEADLIVAATATDPAQTPGQYCKARYFIGMKLLLSGDAANASDEFRKAVETGASDYCEYAFSQAELRTLQQVKP
jgi:lipoprotein NlpI